MLWPVNFSLAYGGYQVLSPFLAYGVEAGLRYSDSTAVDARLKAIEQAFRTELPQAGSRRVLPFHRMADWGADGRIVPGVPVYSPFIRRKEHLDLG